jgi:hypothetical protein
MGFWNRTGETKLERQLRAERPQARDEFVHMLSRRIGPPERARRHLLPKIALVAAVTAALAASLGAAGALGAAGGSVHAFSLGVVHLVSPPRATPEPRSAVTPNTVTHNTVTTTKPATTTTTTAPTTTTSGQKSYEDATPTHWPFQAQYGFRIPICWQGSVIWVTPRELIWYVFHGALPVRSCGGVPIHHHR